MSNQAGSVASLNLGDPSEVLWISRWIQKYPGTVSYCRPGEAGPKDWKPIVAHYFYSLFQFSTIKLSILLYFLFQNFTSFSNDVHNIIGILTPQWILMAWCFGIRAPVATVLCFHLFLSWYFICQNNIHNAKIFQKISRDISTDAAWLVKVVLNFFFKDKTSGYTRESLITNNYINIVPFLWISGTHMRWS